jgi:gamma-glutamyltranspeptidase/glutathione hydrolase
MDSRRPRWTGCGSAATVDDYNQFGSCQAIWRLDDGYVAASDPRRDGQAVGF